MIGNPSFMNLEIGRHRGGPSHVESPQNPACDKRTASGGGRRVGLHVELWKRDVS